MEAIAIGIISGLLATFIVVVIQKLWVSAIEPGMKSAYTKTHILKGSGKVSIQSWI